MDNAKMIKTPLFVLIIFKIGVFWHPNLMENFNGDDEIKRS
jgi:hypothetical protein